MNTITWVVGLVFRMANRNQAESLKSSLLSNSWKSALFYSDQILSRDPKNLEALTGRALALLCARKYTELEQWISGLPQITIQSEALLAIRCKALQIVKDYSKIVQILGGDTENNPLAIPVLSITEVSQSKILTAVRQDALFNLSTSDDVARTRKTGTDAQLSDALSSLHITTVIARSLIDKDPRQLEKYVNFADKSTETDPLVLTACGCLAILNGQTQVGESFFMKAVEEDPDCEVGWLSLIWSYMDHSEWDQGLSTLRKVVRRFPSSENVAMFAMNLHLKSGSPILAWNWILQSDVECVFVRHERGVATMMDGDAQEGSREFQEVLKLAVDRDLLGAASFNLGHCYRKLGEFQKAIESYERALSYDVKQNQVLASIGFCYHLMGEIDQAIRYYDNCLSIDSVHPFATKMLEIALQARTFP
jgi:anaphase-promoting complex subunit 6